MVATPGRQRRRRRRAVWICALGVLVVLVACGAWVGIRALLAKGELESLAPLVSEVESAAHSGDLRAIRATVLKADEHAGRAAELTGDPIWAVAEHLPLLGPDLTAARVTARQTHAIASVAVLPALDAATSLESVHGVSAQLKALRAASPALGRAADTMRTADRALADVGLGGVQTQLSDAVAKLHRAVQEAEPGFEAAAGVAKVAPAMLGEDGARRILVVLQSNAELRTGGGISGQFLELDAHSGTVTLGAAAASSAFPTASEDVYPVPSSTRDLFGDKVGRFVQNTTQTADFTVTARLASAWWQRIGHAAPDAVVSVDPLVLRALLQVTGPIALPDGTQLTAADVARKLLIDPYLDLDAGAQDAYFAMAAGSIFSALLSDHAGLPDLAQAMQQPIAEGRVSVWSAHAAEQAVIAVSEVGGPAIRHALAGSSAFAVYFNDATGAKMDSFLDVAIAAGTKRCGAGGARDVEVAVTLTNTAPADAGRILPGRMTGYGLSGTPMGHIATEVAVAAPAGAVSDGVQIGGAPIADVQTTEGAFPTTMGWVSLAPGESRTLVFRFTAAQDGDFVPTILHTPLVNDVAGSGLTPTCR
ncbi:DUF4012 domain-containing protein [Microbacterium xylanilyticum]